MYFEVNIKWCHMTSGKQIPNAYTIKCFVQLDPMYLKNEIKRKESKSHSTHFIRYKVSWDNLNMLLINNFVINEE